MFPNAHDRWRMARGEAGAKVIDDLTDRELAQALADRFASYEEELSAYGDSLINEAIIRLDGKASK